MPAVADPRIPSLGYRRPVLRGDRGDVSAGPPSLDEERERAVERAFLAGPDGLRAAWVAHGDLVHGFCRRALGRDRAADATQEVFITAWRRRDAFDPQRGALVGWLMGIARYKVLGVLRSEGRAPLPADPDRIDGPVVDGDHVDRIADRLLVAHALRTLPERSRRAVELSFLDGHTHQEVAERLDLPLGTVKSDIRRGLERLRRTMADHDG